MKFYAGMLTRLSGTGNHWQQVDQKYINLKPQIVLFVHNTITTKLSTLNWFEIAIVEKRLREGAEGGSETGIFCAAASALAFRAHSAASFFRYNATLEDKLCY